MKAKRRLSNFDFTAPGSHVALVDKGANGQTILVTKAFTDKQKWDPVLQKYVPLTESGLRVNLSLEDALCLVRDLYPENIEILTQSISKSANGAELVAYIEKADGGKTDLTARKNKLADVLSRVSKDGLDTLAGLVAINQTKVEKSDMTTQAPAAIPEAVQKQLDTQAAENAKLAKALADSEAARTALAADTAILKAAHERAETAAFVTKATALKGCGFPKDATEATVGAALQKLAKAAPAEYAVVEAILTQAADTISKGAALDTVGADGQPAPVANSNSERLTKAAADLRAADKTLTPEQAVAKALDNDPTLYA